ncbi:MAG TPA: hypothetical protein VK929_00890 [Longimicrobiales bacterium]|nr:hypothetical protein [Longimicrobiales bacterium]
MDAVTCRTCGVQHATVAGRPPSHCAVCEDERQYVGWDGQEWLGLEELAATHRAEIREEEPKLLGIGMTPSFAIGQRALLIRTGGGNILWDCIPLLDEAIVAAVRAAGGIAAIAVSHPHFYSSMVEWARRFDAPVLIHEDDHRWVMRPDRCIEAWRGETLRLHDDIAIIRCGGHFPGAAVLHWPAGADGRGALLVSDTIMVARDRRHVSFMRSYPNLIPLDAHAVRRIVDAVAPFRFDRMWSGWWSSQISDDAEASLRVSAERYLRAIGGTS